MLGLLIVSSFFLSHQAAALLLQFTKARELSISRLLPFVQFDK